MKAIELMGLIKQKEELEQKNRLSKKDTAKVKDIQDRIVKLQQFMNDAAAQRTAVKACVGIYLFYLSF